ncbi:MAG: hypothetical protein JWO80_5295 [Bryobacterales bacterium]|nr:hypothetical protein [Bryobacterales bacterium]
MNQTDVAGWLQEKRFARKVRPVTGMHNLQQAVLATNDHFFIRQMLHWVSNSGPFWDEDRASNRDDLFYFEGVDVTDQGLGEVRRRVIKGQDAGSFSFSEGAEQHFARTPLKCYARS